MNEIKRALAKEYIKSYVAYRKNDIKERVDAMKSVANKIGKNLLSLLIIQIGDNFASNKYVGGKVKDCEEVGIGCVHAKLSEATTTEELVDYITRRKDNYSGIIVQLPLPKHIDVEAVTKAIPAEADVDGFKAESEFVPCTPLGVYNLLMDLFEDDKRLDGKNVVILGRSEIVGKPMANLLITKTDATVTVCNSHTRDLSEITKNADILISAIGRAKYVTGDMVKAGATVIDVGINMDENGKMCGDVDWKSLSDDVDFVSPVPGGVGLLTRLSLLENVCDAARLQ